MENFLKPQEPSSAKAAFRQDLACPGAFSLKGRNVRAVYFAASGDGQMVLSGICFSSAYR